MSLEENNALQNELEHQFQFHTAHNFQPPSEGQHGNVRLSPEILEFMASTIDEVILICVSKSHPCSHF